MQKDTRSNNLYFRTTSPTEYASDYVDKVSQCIKAVSKDEMDKALNLIKKTGRIFAAGNGGSAATSDHLQCDWTKGIYSFYRKPIPVISLSSNMASITAIANDLSYNDIFSFQLELQDLQYHDTVVLISASGNSPNIVKAARFARTRNAQVIGMTGFSGGELKSLSTVSLHIPFENYGVVEDCHSMLMHILAQYRHLTT